MVTLIGVRMIWMFGVPLVTRVLRPRGGEPAETHAELLVLGWSGMRGGVCDRDVGDEDDLGAVGKGMAGRGQGESESCGERATLVIPGLTLSPLVRRLGVSEEDELARKEARAHVALAQSALRHIDELAEHQDLSESIAEPLRTPFEQRIHRLEPEIDDEVTAGDEAAVAQQIRELRRDLIAVERRRLGELRRRGGISAESVRRIEHELDLEDSRLSS
ncbi:MAG: hypothetical protein ACTHMY_22215 [Solirubrobacteraceae bacterium]